MLWNGGLSSFMINPLSQVYLQSKIRHGINLQNSLSIFFFPAKKKRKAVGGGSTLQIIDLDNIPFAEHTAFRLGILAQLLYLRDHYFVQGLHGTVTQFAWDAIGIE